MMKLRERDVTQSAISCEISLVSSFNVDVGLLNKGYYAVQNCSGGLMASNLTLSALASKNTFQSNKLNSSS